MTRIFPGPQYFSAIGVTAVRPSDEYLTTRSCGIAREKIQAFSAQNSVMPRIVRMIAFGRCSRGALVSSAAVDTTSNPQKARIPSSIAVQNPLNPCVALNGLNGARVIPPGTRLLTKTMVRDSATTTVDSIIISVTANLVDASAPR